MAARVGIIGASHVGAHVADALLRQGLVSELLLCDKDVALCRAQVNDLLDAMAFYPHAARVVQVDARYEELASCDVVVNAAGHVAAADCWPLPLRGDCRAPSYCVSSSVMSTLRVR